MAPMATTLPARNRYGTRSAILGPGVPWRTSLIHRMGWRMGWPTAKKIQKLRAALASATLAFIWLTDWKKSAQAPPWMAMPPMLKASESKRGEAEDIGRSVRQGAAVAATGVLLHLVGVSATGLLHPAATSNSSTNASAKAALVSSLTMGLAGRKVSFNSP